MTRLMGVLPGKTRHLPMPDFPPPPPPPMPRTEGRHGGMSDRCFLCRKPDDYAGVLVTLDGAVRLVCGRCWDRDEARIPLPEEAE